MFTRQSAQHITLLAHQGSGTKSSQTKSLLILPVLTYSAEAASGQQPDATSRRSPFYIAPVRIPHNDPPPPEEAHKLLVKKRDRDPGGTIFHCQDRPQQELLLHILTVPVTPWSPGQTAPLATRAPKIITRGEARWKAGPFLEKIKAKKDTIWGVPFIVEVCKVFDERTLQVLDARSLSLLRNWAYKLRKHLPTAYECLRVDRLSRNLRKVNGSRSTALWTVPVNIPIPAVDDMRPRAVFFREDHAKADELAESDPQSAIFLRRRANASAVALYYGVQTAWADGGGCSVLQLCVYLFLFLVAVRFIWFATFLAARVLGGFFWYAVMAVWFMIVY